jgi:hypothetical protein
MRLALFGCSIFLFVACTGNVQVGGPAGDSGGVDVAAVDGSSGDDATSGDGGLTCQGAGGFCTGVGGCLDPDGGKKYIIDINASDCQGASVVCCTTSCAGDDNFDCCNGGQTNRPECVNGHVGCLAGFTQQPKGTCGNQPDGGPPYYDDAGSCPGTCSTPADIGCPNWYRTNVCAFGDLCCVLDAGTSDGGASALCTSTGGTVTTNLCCTSVSDFPNTCLIGACGCAPSSSHTVNVCSCPATKCFDPAVGCK